MRVALLTAGDPDRVTGGYLFHRRVAARARDHDADVSFASVPDVPLPWAIPGAAPVLRSRAVRESDVVALDSIAAAAAAPWLRAVRQPIVGMVHQPLGGMDAGPLARAVRAPFDRWAYERAELLMVASDALADQLVAAGVSRRRLRVVLPGNDVAPDGGHADPAVSRTALRGGRRIAALTVANWLPRKGIVELLDAVARLPDELLTLHLVGDAGVDRSYARRVRRRLTKADLRSRVVLHGIRPAPEVRNLYRGADVFVLPSFHEPYGTVWGEAMAAGLPIVGWRAGNLPFLADDGVEALIVPPGAVGALAEALERLAREADLRDRLGRAAAKRAVGRPTWEDTAVTFFSIIRDVLERGFER